MEIIGKYKDKLIIKCEGGYYHKQTIYSGSGCFFCEHEKGITYFDYLNIDELEEIIEKKYYK